MASALIGGLSARGPLTHMPIVVEPLARARTELEGRYAVRTMETVDASLAGCTAIVLAVKPQQMHAAVAALKPHVGGALVISIAAGVQSTSIMGWLGREVPIVRCMPNTPALIGQGITGLCANAAVSPSQRLLADSLLAAVGTTVWVEHEVLLDAVTAVSGSGPAYVFYLIEALERAASELGLDPQASSRLALATFSGSVRLAEASKEPLSVLRERVTSKGGTTHAALTHLEVARVAEHFVEAVHAAARRAHEMGEEFGRP
jgi:pyrroline-5-carboxylate reductase